MRRLAYLVLLPLLAGSACASHDRADRAYHQPSHRFGAYSYRGERWRAQSWRPRGPYPGALRGAGIGILDEWLRETREGRAVVTVGWRDAHGGEVSEEIAHRANIWFRRYADRDRDMILTDGEIRRALVMAAAPYLRRR